MELHAIWNRVDQLEKLLISQAKEIDVLRRMLNSTQVSVQNLTLQGNNFNNTNNNTNCISNNSIFNNNSTVRLIHKPFVGNQVNNNRNSIQLSSIPKGNQQVNNIFNKSTTFNQPTYLMNSFVHPAIAIPPTNLVSTCNNDSLTNKSKINNSNNSSRLDLEANICRGNFSSVSSTMMPPHSSNMNRWSVGPNLRLLDSAVDKTNLDGHNLTTELPHGRHKRQSFVEILTCFCPCFSMC